MASDADQNRLLMRGARDVSRRRHGAVHRLDDDQSLVAMLRGNLTKRFWLQHHERIRALHGFLCHLARIWVNISSCQSQNHGATWNLRLRLLNRSMALHRV